ncbi:hypothetical protein [Chroococcidiopsis sp.]|uniref:hypothetical protein n=1 Tax=Chroococcidiopsis sp. TaxID=3088168 RepID=UPI003F3BC882
MTCVMREQLKIQNSKFKISPHPTPRSLSTVYCQLSSRSVAQRVYCQPTTTKELLDLS